ncbi:MAG: hypothetical protein ACQGVC_23290 [Myxococcota bacterium]
MRVLLSALLIGLLLPTTAAACAVCIGGQTEETRYAFLWTTGFLSVLPLGMIGGAVWWLRRRARELALRELRQGEPWQGPQTRRDPTPGELTRARAASRP